MKINYTRLCVLALIMAAFLVSCTSAPVTAPKTTAVRNYNFSLQNTLSVFLINDKKNFEKETYFCIPVQYMGDYHISSFEYTNGLITIGDYEIPLDRDKINIYVYLNEESDEIGSPDSGFNLVYSEEKGKILFSKMSDPLSIQPAEDDGVYTHYYIFIERYIEDEEMGRIISEYEKANVYSRMEVWYDIVIDNEPQNGSGMLDDFELFNGPASDAVKIIPNLNFFRAMYL